MQAREQGGLPEDPQVRQQLGAEHADEVWAGERAELCAAQCRQLPREVSSCRSYLHPPIIADKPKPNF